MLANAICFSNLTFSSDHTRFNFRGNQAGSCTREPCGFGPVVMTHATAVVWCTLRAFAFNSEAFHRIHFGQSGLTRVMDHAFGSGPKQSPPHTLRLPQQGTLSAVKRHISAAPRKGSWRQCWHYHSRFDVVSRSLRATVTPPWLEAWKDWLKCSSRITTKHAPPAIIFPSGLFWSSGESVHAYQMRALKHVAVYKKQKNPKYALFGETGSFIFMQTSSSPYYMIGKTHRDLKTDMTGLEKEYRKIMRGT